MSGRGRQRVDPARVAALDVLRAVRVEDGYTNLVLPAVLAQHGLGGRDAAFVTELAAGTIRRRATYDAVLAACIDRPLRKVESAVLDALRLGTHQLLGMRVPAHAAISTTVDLVRAKVSHGAGGFANAVLRKVSARDLDGWLAAVAPDAGSDPHGHLAVAESHPRWVVDALAEAVGEDDVAALLAADNVPPRVTLVARPGRASRDELPGAPTPYSPYGVTLDGGDPAGVPAVADGRAGVQDEGSQLVALALANAAVTGRDERWVDLCAGPGGKAALLAALAAERGAALTGVELHHHRARLVARAAAAGPGLAGVVQADATRAPFADASADRILLDAPCTGLGALRRRPEARWRRTPGDLAELVTLQRALLAEAARVLRPGGALLYATCSPVLAETAEVVTAILDAHPQLRLDDVRGSLPAVPDAEGPLPGTVQLWPHRHGTDAMFLALLRRE
ncbi:methyltransferase domain-containing protein [Pimelobacter simplex]|uniref:Ribosomal RNA small subunit methyltransferase B n=1 Tax=Nocardioides simplex TaxID=2045 RepID=A0A0A1DJU4_NOCSI|nr:transcription antitermination factor NusB [Pimelobacter simplex]AIY17681.1 Ribosomal RNA small subunit methyltransferase B [Pimelobacter simplex]MCG8150121.1 methyltransferase domain-containing protein [Pimelobacter simplex]GEB13669.1 rRNA cytosine-C5-methyltransferase [Pimelobacter simplex]SFM70226.1 16S rRNA (cytosine967-C5)-methyltransferase [Pimelobacter simplex]